MSVIRRALRPVQAVLVALGVALVALVLAAAPSSAVYGDHYDSYRFGSYCGAVKGKQTIVWQYNGQQTTSEYYATRWPGNYSSCVKRIQYALNDSLCTSATRLTVDGDYGPKTKAAVTAFQKWARAAGFVVNAKLMTIDGVVGPQTWAMLTTTSWSVSQRRSCA